MSELNKIECGRYSQPHLIPCPATEPLEFALFLQTRQEEAKRGLLTTNMIGELALKSSKQALDIRPALMQAI